MPGIRLRERLWHSGRSRSRMNSAASAACTSAESQRVQRSSPRRTEGGFEADPARSADRHPSARDRAPRRFSRLSAARATVHALTIAASSTDDGSLSKRTGGAPPIRDARLVRPETVLLGHEQSTRSRQTPDPLVHPQHHHRIILRPRRAEIGSNHRCFPKLSARICLMIIPLHP
jgi:hypothetical protein